MLALHEYSPDENKSLRPQMLGTHPLIILATPVCKFFVHEDNSKDSQVRIRVAIRSSSLRSRVGTETRSAHKLYSRDQTNRNWG